MFFLTEVKNPEPPSRFRNGKQQAKGMTGYPKVQEALEDTYRYRDTDHYIRVCTVDLSEDWQSIDKRLKEIIKF